MKANLGYWFRAAVLAVLGVVGKATPGQPPPNAQAAKEAETPRIACVNITKVLREFQWAEQAAARITARRLEYVRRASAVRDDLARVNKEFPGVARFAVRTDPMRTAGNLHKEVLAIDNAANKELTQLRDATVVDVYSRIRCVIEAVARERGLETVLAFPGAATPEDVGLPPVAQVMLQAPALMPFYVRPELDLTAAVIDRLNTRYPPDKEDKPAK